MILKDKRFDSIKRKILEDMYNRLMNKENRVVEEEKKIRINMIKKLCTVNLEEEIEEIFKDIVPLLRNKKRSILLMGGNYEEVKLEIEKAIVTYMTTLPKEAKKSAQSRGVSPTILVASPSHGFEKIVEESVIVDSPPHIAIDSESMQVDSTNVTMDRSEDPFKDLSHAIASNIVDYSSSKDEEKENE